MLGVYLYPLDKNPRKTPSTACLRLCTIFCTNTAVHYRCKFHGEQIVLSAFHREKRIALCGSAYGYSGTISPTIQQAILKKLYTVHSAPCSVNSLSRVYGLSEKIKSLLCEFLFSRFGFRLL